MSYATYESSTVYGPDDARSLEDWEGWEILQDFSGYDNVIEYYIQGVEEDYYPEYVNNILDFSAEEKKYIRYAMGDFSRLTGAQFVETTDFESGVINFFKVDGYSDGDYVGFCTTEDGWFDVSWVNFGGDKMSDYEKWLIWHEVGHATGLWHPNNDDSHSDQAFTSDISVMSDNETNSYPTILRDLDVEALRNVWGQASSPAFQHGVDPTLPTLQAVESVGNTALFQDSSGNAYVRQDGYENLLALRDIDEIQYKIDGTPQNDSGDWKLLAAEKIGGIDQTLWGYFDGSSNPKEYWVWDNELVPDPELNYYWSESNDGVSYDSGTQQFNDIADAFGLNGSGYDCSESTDVFRFYNAGTGVHFFTPSPGEKDDIISKPEWGYKYEGVAYKAPTDTGTELYRFYNRDKGYHFLTASKAEADSLTGKPEWGYKYEGRSYKVTQQATSETPNEVHRFYNRGKGIHFYSASDAEANNIIANSLGSGFDLSNALKEDDLLPGGWGYIYEGAAWYVTDC